MSNRMARTWHRLRNTPKLGRDVVTIITTIVVGLGVTGFLLVHQRAHWPWDHEYTFNADFTSAPAISPGHGQEVRIAGVPVGEITKASVTSKGEADLTLQIDPKYTVYKNARLVLRPKSPLNEMYVELDPGDDSAGKLPNNGTIASTQTAAPVQEDAVLQHLDGKTRAAFTTLLDESDSALASSPTSLAAGLNGTDTTVHGLGQVSDALATRRATLAKLVTDLGIVAQAVGHNDTRLASLAKNAQSTLNALSDKNAELNQTLAELPGFEDSLNASTSKITKLTSQLNPTLKNVQNASGTLPKALTKLNGTLDQLASLAKVAAPVVTGARPLVQDLRPLVVSGNRSLVSLMPFTGRLDSITQRLVSSLDYKNNGQLGRLQDFLSNTTSVGSLKDGNGGIFRAEFVEEPAAFFPTTGVSK